MCAPRIPYPVCVGLLRCSEERHTERPLRGDCILTCFQLPPVSSTLDSDVAALATPVVVVAASSHAKVAHAGSRCWLAPVSPLIRLAQAVDRSYRSAAMAGTMIFLRRAGNCAGSHSTSQDELLCCYRPWPRKSSRYVSYAKLAGCIEARPLSQSKAVRPIFDSEASKVPRPPAAPARTLTVTLDASPLTNVPSATWASVLTSSDSSGSEATTPSAPL